ncbi:MAG: S49 family peptidase [Granulosicoccaceae bacterium]|jgi:protease-4
MSDQQPENFEKDLLNRLAFAALNEQRRARRWSILFRTLFLVWLFSFLAILIAKPGAKVDLGRGAAHTALIEVNGIIAAGQSANADNIVTSLREAFENKHARAIILRINSPGGSPVQAGYINDEIIRLRNDYPNKKVYAVIVDICASGGYYVAAAADEIYADKASMVGSIGVLMNGFGFTGSMDKLGVERRLLTAGKNKGFLDPFSPLKDEEVAHAKTLLDNIHEQFINVVKNGRGDRLADDERLFSGYIWTGEKSMELGLVDGLGNSSYVAREVVGEEDIVDYTKRPDFLDRFAEQFGVAMANTLGMSLGLKQLSIE